MLEINILKLDPEPYIENVERIRILKEGWIPIRFEQHDSKSLSKV